ncbi:hypothetical protein TI39_contig374g00030 [Zymoseptoria brevis]|uniref:Uncharacterized protein n=1 Tax=Zymoseptoria brevis TaxID=1047168 RepID=A0A0F4GNS6_9PEZI|nr:hypothetical protein TI39_contig374g00030 [Zymoseptoria brevis]
MNSPIESGAPFADSQYDMLDDMSEISTDDHDTASIASHDDQTGQLTPEQTASDIEGEEDKIEDMTLSPSVAVKSKSSNTSQHLRQTQAENDLIDSYMSDDLETPRQSTVGRMAPKKAAKHILFFSNSSTPQAIRDSTCAKIASCIEPSKFDNSATSDVVRFPATPTGLCRPSAVINGHNEVVATVQCCVGVKETQGGYKLQIMDSDEKYTSIFTIGHDDMVDLPRPHIAVFYLDGATLSQKWPDIAYAAMRSINVPTLLISESSISESFAAHASNRYHLFLHTEELTNMDRSELKKSIRQLTDMSICFQPITPSMRSRALAKLKKAKNSANLDGFTLLTRLACILITLAAFIQFIAPMMANPSQQLVVRREALATVLEQVTASTNVTKDYNIEHLLPLPSVNCTTNLFTELLPIGPPCKPSSRFQVDSAHSFIISIQPVPGALQTTSTHVSRSDGSELAFNQTKLVNGVYHVTFDENEAYGTITVNMVTRHPRNNFTAVHNFGNPMLHLKTYEKATTDVSKVVTKEVAVIKHAASTFSGKLQSELGAGFSATKNVTSQLALSVARELQVVATKAAEAGNYTVQTITKELATMRNDLIRLPQDVKSKAKSTTRYLMRCTGARIALARDNLGLIKAGLRRHYEKKTLPAPKPKTSMLTDLSTTVKGAGDQLRRDFDRSKKFLAPTEDAASKALRQAKLEVAKAMKQHNKAVDSFKQYMKKTKTEGQTHERKNLKKEMKETERALKKAQLEQRRLDAQL